MKNISIKTIYAMVTAMFAVVVIGILALETDRTTNAQNSFRKAPFLIFRR